MKNIRNIAVFAVLIVAVGVLIAIKQSNKTTEPSTPRVETHGVSEPAAQSPASNTAQTEKTGSTKALPKLIDLGADKCIPCKMMAPILEELKKTHVDKFEVRFMDVWENPDSGKQYNVRVIPTQIFFAPDGKELFRHEGVFGKEDILAKWKELGY